MNRIFKRKILFASSGILCSNTFDLGPPPQMESCELRLVSNSQTCCVAKNNSLPIPLLLLPKCWDYKLHHNAQIWAKSGIKSGVSCVIGKQYTK